MGPSGFIWSFFSKGSANLPSSKFEACRHKFFDSTKTAYVYCGVLAIAYVGALYILVPSRIRKLHRDDHTQIQYRIMASLVVCAAAICSYPYLFCQKTDDQTTINPSENLFSLQQIMFQPSFVLSVLAHVVALYIGPIMAGMLRVYKNRQFLQQRGETVGSYPSEVFRQLIQPDLHSFLTPDSKDEFWKNIRNYIVAPWTEEVIFRGCMVPPLLASGVSVWQVCLTAPLFFGVAHVHHAITRLSTGIERSATILFMTLFQFLYTTLFGMYASCAFVRTGSIWAVTVSHAYCNWMGLPDLSFCQFRHPMYQYRIVLLTSFLVGVFAFKWYLKSDHLLPLPPLLPQMLLSTVDSDEAVES